MSLKINENQVPVDASYTTFSWICSKIIDTVSATAQIVKDVINFGERDIDPETLERWQQGLPKPEPRFRSFHKRIGVPVTTAPAIPNLIPEMIEKGWLDERSKTLRSNSLTNRVALMMFETNDGYKVPKHSSLES